MVCDWNNLAKSVLYLLLGVFARRLGEVGDLVGTLIAFVGGIPTLRSA